MADQATLASRIVGRTGRTSEEANAWLVEAAVQHGYATVGDVPTDYSEPLLCYAEHVGFKLLASRYAGKGSINIPDQIATNKSSVSANFRTLAQDAYTAYVQKATSAGMTVLGAGVTCSKVVRTDGR